MNKRGSLADTIYGPIYIMAIIMTMIISVFIWQSISVEFQEMPNISPTANQSINTVITNADAALSAFDYMVPFLIGGLLLVSLVFAYKRGASVVYIGLALIFWVLALLMAAVFTNTFETFAASFTTITPDFPIAVWVMTNIKWLILGWLFLISVVMFTRNKREDQMLSADQVFQ